MSPVEKKPLTNIATKILSVMSAIGPLKKDKKNEFHGYQYPSDELIVGAVRNELIKNKLTIFTSEKSCSEIVMKTAKGEDQIVTKLEMEFELVDAESGETKTVTFFGYGTDKGDKGVYKAATGAEKYFLMKQFLIATPDDPEFEKNKRAAQQNNSAQLKPPASSPAAVAEKTEKVPQQIVHAKLTGVTSVKPKSGGNAFFRLNGEEGESWITFSETIAKNAKDFAAQGVRLAIALDMHPRGPVVAGVMPA